jgi:ligand-binding sensor domain-containing protein
MLEDRQGRFWIGTNGGGLNRFNPQSHTFTHYRHQAGDSSALISDHVTRLYQDRKGDLWVGTNGYGLEKFDPERGTFTHYRHQGGSPTENFRSDVIRCLYESRAGDLWLGTYHGLSRLNRSSGEITQWLHEEKNENSLSNNSIWGVQEDPAGNLWIVTYGGGLNRLDPQTGNFVRFRKDDGHSVGLKTNNLLSIYSDRRQQLWIGGESAGLQVFDPYHYPVTRLAFPASGNTAARMTTLLEDYSGNIWMGTNGYGLQKIHPQTGKLRTYVHHPDQPASLSNDYIICLAQDSSGYIWIGTNREGVNRMNPLTEECRRYNYQVNDSTGLSFNAVSALFTAPDGTVWVGTTHGLNRFDTLTHTFRQWTSRNSGLLNDNITALGSDRYRRLWIGTPEGLYYLDQQIDSIGAWNGNVFRYPVVDRSAVYFIAETRTGEIWVATQRGLYRISKDRINTVRYTIEQGLPDERIYAVLEDKNNNIWLHTGKGIVRMNVQENRFRHVGLLEGLEDRILFRQSRAGTFFLSDTKQMHIFSPENIRDPVYDSPIVLTSFNVFENAYPLGQALHAVRRAYFCQPGNHSVQLPDG